MTATVTPQQFPSSVLAVGVPVPGSSAGAGASASTSSQQQRRRRRVKGPATSLSTTTRTSNNDGTRTGSASIRLSVANSGSDENNDSQTASILLGRQHRRRKNGTQTPRSRGKNNNNNKCCNGNGNGNGLLSLSSSSSSSSSSTQLLIVAVGLWYSLGIISISTTKLLLSGGVYTMNVHIPPLLLTTQQFVLGSTLLRFWITFLQRQEIPSWAELIQKGKGTGKGTSFNSPHKITSTSTSSIHAHDLELGCTPPENGVSSNSTSTSTTHPTNFGPFKRFQQLGEELFLQRDNNNNNNNNSVRYLLLAGIAFTLGFLSTNFGFGGASASFVETIKAAEPLTSATLAVGTGLEVLGTGEWTSLAAIIIGVLCSTVGNANSSSSTTTTTTTNSAVGSASSSTVLAQSLQSCAIVMISNLCFSLRGLFQKFFTQANKNLNNVSKNNKKDENNRNALQMESVELQFRLQQVGVVMLLVPAIIFHGPGLLPQVIPSIQTVLLANHGDQGSAFFWGLARYVGLAIINGVAFTTYNLASTYLLSRITVVHHAALNCIRRIFAIVVTSIIFGTLLTPLACFGIVISVAGFMAFSYCKAMKGKPSITSSNDRHKRPELQQ